MFDGFRAELAYHKSNKNLCYLLVITTIYSIIVFFLVKVVLVNQNVKLLHGLYFYNYSIDSFEY